MFGTGLGEAVATTFVMGLIFISIGIPVVVLNPKDWSTVLWGMASIACGALFVFVTVVMIMAGTISQAMGRDLDGRYAQSPLKGWFDSLRSLKGPCCSDADGTALSDVDWETKDGHYRVRLDVSPNADVDMKWIDVPDDAVIREPNRAGKTMVWPIYRGSSGETRAIEIRCFMPGSMI